MCETDLHNEREKERQTRDEKKRVTDVEWDVNSYSFGNGGREREETETIE